MMRLDEIAAGAELTTSTDNPFTRAITTATAIQNIRATLTDKVMTEVILPLMNSKLGFKTDKDPLRPAWSKRNNCMETPEPYPLNTVRECLIEATLRGMPPVGNCWNIISGQSYITKEGFWFLIGKKVQGLTDFKVSIGVPKMIKAAGDARNASDDEAKGALVPCSASWKMHGNADRIEREIPIRVNAMMGADAIMGKAERKILAAAYAQITGTMLGDADASEMDAPPMRQVTPSAAPLDIDPIQPFAKEPPRSAIEQRLKAAETQGDDQPML